MINLRQMNANVRAISARTESAIRNSARRHSDHAQQLQLVRSHQGTAGWME
jgi:hypothetical protein